MSKYRWTMIAIMWIATMLVLGLIAVTPRYRIEHITVNTTTNNVTIGVPNSDYGVLR